MRDARNKALARGGSVGAALLLLAALAVMVNYLGWKYHHRFDWTSEQLYSLSEKTENVLAHLDRDVEAVVLLQPGASGGAGGFDVYEASRELLSRYDAASPRFSVRHLDPARDLVEAQRVVDEYGLDQTAAVVFVAGEGEAQQRRVLSVNDLVEFDFSPLQMGQTEEVAGFRGEQRFTRTLVELTAGEKPRVLFTTGHGEISLDDRSRDGFGVARRLLGEDNFEIEEWASLGQPRVPEGTDLLVVGGPTATFLAPELAVFDAYLEAGGRMLLLLDPVIGGAGALVPTGLELWLEGYGVEVGDDVVVDPSSPLPFYGPETLYATRYPEQHPVTRSVARGPLPVLVSLSRSVGRGAPPADLEVTVLAESSDEGWGESDLQSAPMTPGPEDVDGPVPLAVAVASARDGGGGEPAAGDDGSPTEAGGLRLVVVGDSTFAGDRLLDANYANQALLVDAFNWLVEREGMIGLPAKRPEQVRLNLDQSQVRWLFALVLLVLPGLGAAAGVYVHFRRRR